MRTTPPGTTRTWLRDGLVWTPAGPQRGHVLLVGETVAAVGAVDLDEEPGLRVLDLDGRLVTPAFVDAHVHLAATGFARLGADLAGCASAEEALARLARHAADDDLPVLLAHGWDETGWPDAAAFTRAAVTRACGGRPAYVSRVDVHSAVVTDDLVRQAPETPLLEGWSETGTVTRAAHHEMRGAVQHALRDFRPRAIRAALVQAAAAGIGLVHELGAPHLSLEEDLDLLDVLAADPARAWPQTVGYWGARDLTVAQRRGLPGAAGDLCVDGAIGSRTAALRAPYEDGDGDGFLYLDVDDVAEHAVACTEAGLQAGFHAIGDRAVTTVVRGYERAAAKVGRDEFRALRHRVEHLEMVSAQQADRLADLGVVASAQPAFETAWGGPDGLYARRLGSRASSTNPFGALHRAGVTLAFGSDSPVTPFDPWGAVAAAVAATRVDQHLDLTDAVTAHTVGGWTAAGRQGGTLAPGAPASLAVWDTTSLPAGGFGTQPPRCDLTIAAGRVAHDRKGELG